jgi:tryptophanyl-tRNA synthetase
MDARKVFSEFGIEPIEDVAKGLTDIPYFMKRGIVIGHRDYHHIVSAIRNRTPFHILTGFMPSGHPHLGHLMLMKEVIWHVKQGGNGYVTVADREAYAVRGLSWEKCREFGKEYLACLFALGYEGQTYFQTRNDRLKDLAFESATKVNFSELAAIYGFTPETDLAHADSVITQVADILYPQIDREPAPTLVPVGIDQDPHIRLTRGIAHKFRMFTVEEREGHVSVRGKEAPAGAIDAVQKAFPGSKKYEGHVDIRGVACREIGERVREIERSFGGYAFFSPSSTYHIFLPGLTGGKMSSSVPESFISFFEPDNMVTKKVMSGVTGGRMTLAEQKQLGGAPDKCSIFLLNLFHMVTDDQELGEIRKKCLAGEIMCGQCKKETAARVVAFLQEFREKMAAVQDTIRV